MIYAILFIGGGLGTVLRFAVYRIALTVLPAGFPFGTFIVNIFGSFVMGILAAWFLRSPALAAQWRLFLMTGVLGGFTTFSAFSLDAFELWQRQSHGLAVLYVISSVVASIAAVCAGGYLVRAVS